MYIYIYFLDVNLDGTWECAQRMIVLGLPISFEYCVLPSWAQLEAKLRRSFGADARHRSWLAIRLARKVQLLNRTTGEVCD